MDVAEIVVLSGETRRLTEFLDEQLDPDRQPLAALLSDRLPQDRWLVLRDLLRRKIAFFCISWLTWNATLDVAKRLRVTESPEAFLVDVPAEIHELMWADIPADILSAFDNTEAYRSFNDGWSESVHEWARERGWSPLSLPFRAWERSDEFLELQGWLEQRGYGDDRKPFQNLLIEVMVEIANRAKASVVQSLSPEDELTALLQTG